MINEIVLYQLNDLSTKLEVRVEDETIWLTQAQIILLFNSSKANISEHIKHIFQTHELKENATVRKFRTVRKEGNRTDKTLLPNIRMIFLNIYIFVVKLTPNQFFVAK